MSDDLKRSLLLLTSHVRLLEERIRLLETSGRQVSMLPITILQLHPITPRYMIPDQIYLAVVLEEQDTQAPVIVVNKESLRKFLLKTPGDLCTLHDYQQTPHVAQKKYIPKQGWVWECPFLLPFSRNE